MKKLICQKCHKDNILDARYCIKCGNKFTDSEISKARRFTFVGILELLDKLNNIKDLSFITQSKIFRIGSITIVLLIGFINIYQNGNNIKLNKNDNYEIKHYKDTFYVILNKEKTILDLYIPNRFNYLELEFIDNDKLNSTTKFELNEKIEISSNDEDSYYLINGIADNYKETIKVKLVYKGKK